MHNAQINENSDDERNASESGRGKKEKEEQKEQNLGKFKNPQELLRAYGELEKSSLASLKGSKNWRTERAKIAS